jgi:hypothetical protein
MARETFNCLSPNSALMLLHFTRIQKFLQLRIGSDTGRGFLKVATLALGAVSLDLA